MSVLAHGGLTNYQALPRPSAFAAGHPTHPSRVAATLRLWRRRARQRADLATLGERELRDMGASTADVWRETRQPFWRASPPL